MTFYTPPQIGKLLGVAPDRVRGWILAGELIGFNVGDATRPRWRVSDEALQKFQEKRSPVHESQPKPKRRRKPDGDVIEFFK